MSPEEKAAYKKIAEELFAMGRRLAELSEAGFSDMEGSDMPEFAISELLYCLEYSALRLTKDGDEINRLLGS